MIELKFDKGISLNDWYSGTHWSKRQAIKKAWKLITAPKLAGLKEKYEQYTIELEYNSRLDPSNTIPTIKMVEDILVERGHLVNDTKKYCKQILIKPNLELPSNTYILRVYEYKQ